MRICVHPDDPPRNILALPRVVSNEEDIAKILDQHDSLANDLTLRSGSLGANPANDLPIIASRFTDPIHFANLLNVRWEPDGSFQETAHLDSDTDMVVLVKFLLDYEARRRMVRRMDTDKPLGPDHGHELLDDFKRQAFPVYHLTGRMCRLAELHGIIPAICHYLATEYFYFTGPTRKPA